MKAPGGAGKNAHKVTDELDSANYRETLVPKLRLGTRLREALLRTPARRRHLTSGDLTGSRASRTCVPKQSLGTRSTRRRESGAVQLRAAISFLSRSER